MLNKTKRILALLLAVVLVFSLVGCSKKEDDGSSVIYQEQIEYEYVEGEDGSTGGSTGGSQGGSTGGSQGGSTGGSQGGSTGVSIGVNPADYKGVTIQFATTVDPKDEGTQYVIDKFTNKYGIKVEPVACTLDNYATEMTALISAGKAPTVGRSNGDFPACLGYFQSLDAAKIDYKDDIWNQNTFKLTTYNGAPYMCDTVGNLFAELDLVVYSKSLLKRANCPTPQELDAAGKWNFDSFAEIGKKTAQLPGCNGLSVHVYDALFHMTGATAFGLDSTNHITNGITNETTALIQKIAQLKKDGGFGHGSDAGLIDGSIAMTTHNLWALRKDGPLAKHPNISDLGFYYLPNQDNGQRPVTGIFRGWGIMKGCNQNPATGSKAAVAGGIFLRYYLDVNNYNIDNMFLSQEAEDFFFELTSLDYDKVVYNPYLTYINLSTGITGIEYNKEFYSQFIFNDPAQIPTQMSALKSKVQNGVDKLNKFIDQQIAAK